MIKLNPCLNVLLKDKNKTLLQLDWDKDPLLKLKEAIRIARFQI